MNKPSSGPSAGWGGIRQVPVKPPPPGVPKTKPNVPPSHDIPKNMQLTDNERALYGQLMVIAGSVLVIGAFAGLALLASPAVVAVAAEEAIEMSMLALEMEEITAAELSVGELLVAEAGEAGFESVALYSAV